MPTLEKRKFYSEFVKARKEFKKTWAKKFLESGMTFDEIAECINSTTDFVIWLLTEKENQNDEVLKL